VNPEEDRAWAELVDHTRRDLFPKLEESSLFLSMCPSGEPDVKFCLELGAAIMYDKPIILLVMPGRAVPPSLERIAVGRIDADPDTEAGREHIGREVRRIMEAYQS